VILKWEVRHVVELIKLQNSLEENLSFLAAECDPLHSRLFCHAFNSLIFSSYFCRICTSSTYRVDGLTGFVPTKDTWLYTV
jgi:hypothetical protein